MKAVLAVIYAARVVAALVGVWQVIGLLPVFTWLAAPAQVTPGMWFVVVLKLVILMFCVLVFYGLKRVAAKVRSRSEAQRAAA